MIAYVQRIVIGRRGAVMCEIRCPLCDKTHTHGWADYMLSEPSHRVRHCVETQPWLRDEIGYDIITPYGLPVGGYNGAKRPKFVPDGRSVEQFVSENVKQSIHSDTRI